MGTVFNIPKKYFGLGGLCGLEAAERSQGGTTLSGTTRDRRLGQKESFEPKKNFGLCGHWRPLEGPGEARHCQGPPGIVILVKRNHLSKKKFGLCGLEAAGGSRGGPHYQGPPGIDAWVKRNC